MKINLENYLKKNRLLLDIEQPDEDKSWETIVARINNKRNFSPHKLMKFAAVFLLGAFATYFVLNKTGMLPHKQWSLSDISAELGEQEAELEKVAFQKWEELKPLIKNNTTEFQFLLDELNELDNIQKIYLTDLNQSGANEYIIRALLDYHEKKIQILDRLLLEIQKQKNHETKITL